MKLLSCLSGVAIDSNAFSWNIAYSIMTLLVVFKKATKKKTLCIWYMCLRIEQKSHLNHINIQIYIFMRLIITDVNGDIRRHTHTHAHNTEYEKVYGVYNESGHYVEYGEYKFDKFSLSHLLCSKAGRSEWEEAIEFRRMRGRWMMMVLPIWKTQNITQARYFPHVQHRIWDSPRRNENLFIQEAMDNQHVEG